MSSFLKLSFSDLLRSQGKHFSEKLKIQIEKVKFKFLSKPPKKEKRSNFNLMRFKDKMKLNGM